MRRYINIVIFVIGLNIFSGMFFFAPAMAQEQKTSHITGPQEPPFIPVQPIAIVGGTLIDATGAMPKIGYTVVIEGRKITKVGRSEDVKIPKDAQVINAEGMTIMPGIINSNQHLQLDPLFSAGTADITLEAIKELWEENFSRMPHRAYVYLMQGITSMRQTSGPYKRMLSVKKKIDAGEIAGPRVFLGGALFMSKAHFQQYIEKSGASKEVEIWLRDNFAYNVIDDVAAGTDPFTGPEFNFWKLYMSDEIYDGKNDFSDEDLREIIKKAHKYGKIIDVHAGGHNAGLRRMLDFDIDTLEHPFYGHELIDEDIIEGYVKKGAIIDTLLRVMVAGAEHAQDPHRFNETQYIMSMTPEDYRQLLRYRDKMLDNKRNPDRPGRAVYQADKKASKQEDEDDSLKLFGPSYNKLQAERATSHENMRRFIKAGAKFSLGTDTPTFLNFLQDDPHALEYGYMIKEGMTPMSAIIAATRNGAEALGLANQLGTIEEGKLADVIVVAGNPLADLNALKRVYVVIKDGVRYK
ncbi:MAG: hypothetical protein COB49_08355 [Alphaproteobacteria bacterium]|nr:MAG: hypothetical protein COB49_08355 [Alphaproteobacteria bacterium]